MNASEPDPDLFWVTASIVALVAVWVLAKAFLTPRQRRPGLWVSGLALLFPACAVPASPAPLGVTLNAPVGSYGWSSPHMPIDHYPPTGRDLLQRT